MMKGCGGEKVYEGEVFEGGGGESVDEEEEASKGKGCEKVSCE